MTNTFPLVLLVLFDVGFGDQVRILYFKFYSIYIYGISICYKPKCKKKKFVINEKPQCFRHLHGCSTELILVVVACRSSTTPLPTLT